MPYNNDDGADEIKLSKYNSGVAKEMRRNDIWKDVNRHKRDGKFQKWNEDLDCIWCELAADLQDKENDEESDFKLKKKEFDDFDLQLAKAGSFDDNPNRGFAKLTNDKVSKRNKHYKILMDKELFLRMLENKLGKGTKWQEDEDDFD